MFGHMIHTDDDNPRTWCLLTKPQAETKLCALLASNGVAAFFAARTKTRHRQTNVGRVKYYIESPIIPRLIFAEFPSTPHWHVIRSMPFVAQVFGHNGEPVPIRPDDVAGLRKLRNSLRAVEVAKRSAAVIKAGDRIEVTQGPLTGFVAQVARTHASCLIVDTEAGELRLRADIVQKRALDTK